MTNGHQRKQLGLLKSRIEVIITRGILRDMCNTAHTNTVDEQYTQYCIHSGVRLYNEFVWDAWQEYSLLYFVLIQIVSIKS